MDYAFEYPSVARSPASERATFIRRTYAHLAGAILAFAAIEWVIFGLISQQDLDSAMLRYLQMPFSGLILMLVFMGGGYLARRWAYSGADAAMQYAGLAVYVVLEAAIFVPLLWFVMRYAGNPTELLTEAGVLTLCLFGALTTVAFVTRKDFSFLGPILTIASFLMLGVFILGMIFGFGGLSLWIAFAMIALAAGFILYDTSNVLHHFRTDMHVAASLELFASVAVLFYYIIIVLMSRGRNS